MIEREGVWMPLSEGYCKEYDLHVKEDMLFGKIGENFTKDLFEGNTKMEIKTERDIWKRTGNIVIELKSRGKYSGLSTTEAEWWAHILSYKGKIESVILIPVKDLKERVKLLVKQEKATLTLGGDDNTSEIVLIPIKEIHGSF